jgi:isopentenyl-diphosphate delta-isomerase
MAEELNLSGLTLRYVDQIEYRAEVGNGLIEHEVVDCFIAICDTPPLIHPNPSEVMDYTWIDPTTLKHRITATPQNYTKWLQIYVQDHFEALFQSGCEMSTS